MATQLSIVETGVLYVGGMPWLTTARVDYDTLVRRATRRIARRGWVTIYGTTAPAKLRAALRREAHRIGLNVRTYAFHVGVVGAGLADEDAADSRWWHRDLRMELHRGRMDAYLAPVLGYPAETRTVTEHVAYLRGLLAAGPDPA